MSVPIASCKEKKSHRLQQSTFPGRKIGKKYILQARHRWSLLTLGTVQVSTLQSGSREQHFLPFNQALARRIYSPGEVGPLLQDEIVMFSSLYLGSWKRFSMVNL